VNISINLTTETSNLDPLQLMKQVCPDALELAGILRQYLVDAEGRWHGHKLWMAVDIAQGAFEKKHHQEEGK